MSWLLTTSALVYLLTMVGGAVPLLFRGGARLQHLLASVAAGVFLGAVFLHLLPEVAGMATEHQPGIDAAGLELALPAEAEGESLRLAGEDAHEEHGEETIWLALLAGVVSLFLVEQLFLRGSGATVDAHHHGDEDGHAQHDPPGPVVDDACHEDHIEGDERHRMVGMATFVGLSLHAFTDGLGLSTGYEMEDLRGALATAILSHKAIGGFSLCAALMLARFPLKRVLGLMLVFAAITPLGAFARVLAFPSMGADALNLLTAFAAGTFLYVALCDLLPEVFHERRDAILKVLLVTGGIGVSHLIHLL